MGATIGATAAAKTAISMLDVDMTSATSTAGGVLGEMMISSTTRHERSAVVAHPTGSATELTICAMIRGTVVEDMTTTDVLIQ